MANLTVRCGGLSIERGLFIADEILFCSLVRTPSSGHGSERHTFMSADGNGNWSINGSCITKSFCARFLSRLAGGGLVTSGPSVLASDQAGIGAGGDRMSFLRCERVEQATAAISTSESLARFGSTRGAATDRSVRARKTGFTRGLC